jgi:hypothetical protein
MWRKPVGEGAKRVTMEVLDSVMVLLWRGSVARVA